MHSLLNCQETLKKYTMIPLQKKKLTKRLNFQLTLTGNSIFFYVTQWNAPCSLVIWIAWNSVSKIIKINMNSLWHVCPYIWHSLNDGNFKNVKMHWIQVLNYTTQIFEHDIFGFDILYSSKLNFYLNDKENCDLFTMSENEVNIYCL